MKSLALVTTIVLVLLQQGFVSDSADAEETDNLRIYEVNAVSSDSKHPDEGFSLKNYGGSTINLKDWVVFNDLEGYIKFESDLNLEAGKTITIVRDTGQEGSYFIKNHDCYTWGTNGIHKTGDFEFADEGGCLKLKHGDNGQAIDAFYYGNCEIDNQNLWKGRQFPEMREDSRSFAVRSTFEGGNANAWHFFGTYESVFDPTKEFDAEVTPMLFPESGGIPIYRALEQAKKSIFLAMYTMNSDNILGCLYDRLENGVEVTMLLEEKSSEETMDAGQLRYLQKHDENPAKIYVIPGDNQRFFHMHAKYCIIDDETVIVMSENWTSDTLNGKVVDDPELGEGNRGWGAIVKCKEYAKYLKNFFENDISLNYGDIKEFDTEAKAKKVTYEKPTDEYPTKTYQQKITPFMSPGSSWDAVMHYIDNAESRLYVQQQGILNSYLDMTVESPITHMAKKAESGSVDTRFLFCMKDEMITETLTFINKLNSETKVKAGYMYIPYLHNKGLVCDDTAIVTTVNWTGYGFNSNREIGIAIHSKDIADFFANAFDRDFERNYRADNKVSVSIEGISPKVEGTDYISATATIGQAGKYKYEWKLDGVEIPSVKNTVRFSPTLGSHVLTLTVIDDYDATGTCTLEFEVKGFTVSGNTFIILSAVAAAMIVAAAQIYLQSRRKNNLS